MPALSPILFPFRMRCRTAASTLALLIGTMSLTSCDRWLDDDDSTPATAAVTGGWFGYACDGSNDGILNAAIDETDGIVTGSWVIELPASGEILRGEIFGQVTGNRLTLAFEQDDPCFGNYQVTGTADDSKLRLTLSGGDCLGERNLEIEIGQPGVAVLSPCTGVSGPPGSTSLVDALAVSSIARSPLIPIPSLAERSLLAADDSAITAELTESPFTATYDSLIVELLDDAGVSTNPSSTGLALADLLLDGYVGGIAGHDFFALDGKYLGMLSEMAIWRVGRQAGVWGGSAEFAIDQIVSAHNGTPGTHPDGLVYARSALPTSVLPAARSWERNYFAPIVMQHYAHIFGYHALLRLRTNSGELPSTARFSSALVNEADYMAGALLAKLDIPFSAAQDAYDLLQYYAFQRNSPASSILSILTPAGQSMQLGSSNLSIADRKAALATGYRDMEDELNITVPDAPRLFGSGDGDGPPLLAPSPWTPAGAPAITAPGRR